MFKSTIATLYVTLHLVGWYRISTNTYQPQHYFNVKSLSMIMRRNYIIDNFCSYTQYVNFVVNLKRRNFINRHL